MIKNLLTSIFCLLLCLSANAAPQQTQQALQQKVEQWHEQLAQNKLNPNNRFIIRMQLIDAYQKLGQIDKALAQSEKNLELSRQTSINKAQLIAIYNQASDVFSSIGQLLKAEHYAELAIQLLDENTLPSLSASSFLNRGNIATLLGDFKPALNYYSKGMVICWQYDLSQILLKIKINRLFPMWQLSPEKALKDSNNLLSHVKHQHNALITIATLLMAQKNEKTGQLTVDYLLASLELANKQQDARALSISNGYLARIYHQQDRNKEALKLLEKAILYAQSQAMPEYSYQWYSLKARIYKQLGQLNNALQASQRSIALLSPIRNQLDRGVRSPINSFEQAVKSVYYLQADLLLQKAHLESNKSLKQELLTQARDSIEALKVAELENYFQDDCVANLQARKKDISQLTQNVAVYYPIILPDRLEILLSTQQGIQQFRVNVSANQLNQQISLLRKGLQTRPNNRYLHPASQLYNWLIQPVWQGLSQYDTMVVIADGSLRTIPFSTLYDGKQYLIEKIALAAAPGFQLIEPQAINWQQSKILLAGLSDAVQDFSPLPSVPRELSQIQNLIGGEKILDKSYTLDAIQSRLEENAYSVIHLATHAQFSGPNEQNYLLTHDHKMTMDRLKSMIGFGKFREKPIELLTMSACQTALGDDRAALGLAGVAIKAGARSALATLWFVDDEATSKAIVRFYSVMRAGKSKAKALQQTQIELLKQPRFAHPAYWSPFLLIGNWL